MGENNNNCNERENLFQLVSLVERAPNRRKVLIQLNEADTLTPSEMAEETTILKQNISRAISELEQCNLIHCLNPSAQKYRYYEITEKGKEVLEKVSER